MAAVKRILTYIRGTSSYALRIGAKGDPFLCVYADADGGGDREDRRSKPGFLIQVEACIVFGRTMKKKLAALSSTETKFMLDCDAVKEWFGFGKSWKNWIIGGILHTVLYRDEKDL